MLLNSMCPLIQIWLLLREIKKLNPQSQVCLAIYRSRNKLIKNLTITVYYDMSVYVSIMRQSMMGSFQGG